MSEGVITTDWAEPEVMTHYHGMVTHFRNEHLAIHPNAKRALVITKPHQCAKAFFLLDDLSLSMRQIREETGLNDLELGQLIFKRPETWEQRKPRLAAKLAQAAEGVADLMLMKVERVREDPTQLDEIQFKDLALAGGITTDKSAGLNGVATTIVEHRSGPSVDEALQFREDVRRRLAEKAKEGAIDV